MNARGRLRPPRAIAVMLMVVVAVGPACSEEGSPDVIVTDPALGATGSEVAAMYLDFSNHGGDDAVVAASCTCAEEVTLHITDHAGGRSKMVDADVLELPAGAEVRMGPAGSHVMLEQLTVPLHVGGSVEVTLEFERSDPRTIQVPIVELASLNDRIAR